MKEKSIIATLLAGTGAFIFSNAIYHKFVLRQPKYPFGRALLCSGLFLGAAYLISKSGTAEGEKEQYSGIIIDPNEVKATCHCEPICRIACFAKGAIGALSEEQIKKYCPDKYEKLKKVLEENKKA